MSEAMLRFVIFGGLILLGAVLVGLEAQRAKKRHDGRREARERHPAGKKRKDQERW